MFGAAMGLSCESTTEAAVMAMYPVNVSCCSTISTLGHAANRLALHFLASVCPDVSQRPFPWRVGFAEKMLIGVPRDLRYSLTGASRLVR
jgi:hypothetical protein